MGHPRFWGPNIAVTDSSWRSTDVGGPVLAAVAGPRSTCVLFGRRAALRQPIGHFRHHGQSELPSPSPSRGAHCVLCFDPEMGL